MLTIIATPWIITLWYSLLITCESFDREILAIMDDDEWRVSESYQAWVTNISLPTCQKTRFTHFCLFLFSILIFRVPLFSSLRFFFLLSNLLLGRVFIYMKLHVQFFCLLFFGLFLFLDKVCTYMNLHVQELCSLIYLFLSIFIFRLSL
jgi:hypothetical protein